MAGAGGRDAIPTQIARKVTSIWANQFVVNRPRQLYDGRDS